MPASELDDLLARVPAPMADLTRRARALVLDVRPDAIERVWPGWKNVGYAVGPAMSDVICMLSPAKSWVRFSFVRTDLPDPAGLLGESDAKGHHVRLASVAELDRPEMKTLVRVAFAAGPREKAAGPRQPRERESGAYVASASKTVNVPLADLYFAWSDEATRQRWLPEPFDVRKQTENRSMRITWADGSSVEALFLDKGAGKSSVQLDHTKLADADAAERMRAFWKERLGEMKAQLER
jgi:uncharacterized protein YndB with AHSA1/START domain